MTTAVDILDKLWFRYLVRIADLAEGGPHKAKPIISELEFLVKTIPEWYWNKRLAEKHGWYCGDDPEDQFFHKQNNSIWHSQIKSKSISKLSDRWHVTIVYKDGYRSNESYFTFVGALES